MASNPSHYVALVIASPTPRTENGPPVKQLKLLHPDASLLLGHVYRLVSFEDVLKEFAANKSVKLEKLLRESGGLVLDSTKKNSSVPNPILVHENSLVKVCQCRHELVFLASLMVLMVSVKRGDGISSQSANL